MNKLGTYTVVIIVGLLAAHHVASAQTRDLASLFPYEADVAIGEPGIHLVPLTAEVLSRTQPDLRDLRVFDAAGAEVPWTVESAVPAAPRLEARELTVRDLREATERPPFAAERKREVLTLDLPTGPSDGVAWDLVLSTERPRFVRRILVERLDRGGAAAEVLFEGSIYRLPNPTRERLRVPLAAAGTTVRVTLVGEDTAFLSPRAAVSAVHAADEPQTIALELAVSSTESSGGRTIVRLDRPRGLVPGALRIETTTPTFLRDIRVLDVGHGGDVRAIGAGRIYRVADVTGAVELDVPLSRASGDTLEVSIDDGDSPALGSARFVAIVARPALLVDAPGALVVRYGGARALAPRYDLTRVARLPEVRELLDRGVSRGALSASRPNPLHDPAPALAFAMRAGSDAEIWRFSHMRSLLVSGGGEGSTRVRLSAADLAVMRPDLGDVRVVDDAGAQWPFLLERDAAIDDVQATIARHTEDGCTHYALALPAHPIPVSALALTVTSPFLDRDYELVAITGEQRRTVARGRLVRRPDSDDALRIEMDALRVDALELVVDDGGDAPLPISVVRAEVHVPELYVAAPGNAYRIVLGSPATGAPRYELGRARAIVLSVDAEEGAVGSLIENPGFVPERRSFPFDEMLLWAVLSIAVLVLGGLTLRVAKRETPPTGESGGDSGEDGSRPKPEPPVPPPTSGVSSTP